MRLGAALPTVSADGSPIDGNGFADGARTLEDLGYESIWVFDAIGRGFMLPDPLMARTVAATVTDEVELGTGVLQLSLRNTVETAHRALTLHHLAEGRFLFGVGPGSTRTDFETLGGDFDDRFGRFERELPILRQLLSTGRSGAADLAPWPTTAGGPPLFLAGWRGRWVERAATESDGWIASGRYADDETLADGIDRFRAAGGRRAIVTTLGVGPELGPMIERLHHLAELGFDDAVVVDPTPAPERLRQLREAITRG
jgi:alkanesulfonate monooxygenase SsuD/methylene tetrahydromethanopterin reductase-like flavin-dependent oxidoreductase (luciferase family)